MTAELEALRHARVSIDGVPREITLHLPRVAELFRLIVAAETRGPALAEGALVAELIQVVDVDGEPIDEPVARRLLQAPEALATLLAARNRLYLHACEQGRARAACPRCGGEAELDLVFYAVALGAPPWDLFERGILPLAPLLAGDQARGTRPPGVPMAARLAFDLPAARLGVAEAGDAVRGVLGDLDPAAEEAAWARWAPPDADQPNARIHWRRKHPGFRATLRLAVALQSLEDAGGQAIDPTPEAVEHLFGADFHFLDLLYRFTHALDAPPEATVACPRCGTRFLPFR